MNSRFSTFAAVLLLCSLTNLAEMVLDLLGAQRYVVIGLIFKSYIKFPASSAGGHLGLDRSLNKLVEYRPWKFY